MKIKLPWAIIFLTILSLVAGWQLLLKGYFPMHDDLQVMRLYEMRRCFNDGQIPCRWNPDMDNNYGQPMFNYYSAFPYYFGMVFNLIGFQFVDTAKILFLLSLLVSSIFTYLLARRFFSVPASILAAAAYLIAPYHALDIFVRGALAESWGLAFIPAVLYSLSMVIETPTMATSTLLALTTAGLLTTHNLTVLMNAPVLVIFTIISFFIHGFSWAKLKYLVLGGLLGIGLSAFFLFPVLVEQNLTQGMKFLTSDYFSFRAHFATLRQLFLKTFWTYGPSEFGPNDKISFFVGVVQIFGLVVSPFVLIKNFKNKKLFFITLFFTATALASVFMTHGKSDPIWTLMPVMAFVQFPWRFLGLTILGTAIIIGSFVNIFKTKLQLPIMAIGIVLLIAFNYRYYHFEKWFYWINDEQKLSGELYNLQIRAAVLDYLPNSAVKIPETKAKSQPQVLDGNLSLNYFDNRSAYFASEVDVMSDSATLQFPVIYFPNWQVYQDRAKEPYPFTYDNDFGLITVKLSKGHHLIQAFFNNTPIRTLSNSITIVSAITLICLLTIAYARPKKHS